MKELIRVRVQYASRQQCCKTHKRPLPFTFLPLLLLLLLLLLSGAFYFSSHFVSIYLPAVIHKMTVTLIFLFVHTLTICA